MNYPGWQYLRFLLHQPAVFVIRGEEKRKAAFAVLEIGESRGQLSGLWVVNTPTYGAILPHFIAHHKQTRDLGAYSYG